MTAAGEVIDSFPPERIDFDPTNIPSAVLSRLEEALDCHAVGANRAAGAMLRATVESLCDERGAEGDTLNQRLRVVAAATGVRAEYVDAMHSLRLLGNDSVHAVAKDFENVDESVITDAVRVVKTILNIVYQHQEILNVLSRHQAPRS